MSLSESPTSIASRLSALAQRLGLGGRVPRMVFEPIVTCWNIVHPFPTRAPADMNVPERPCGVWKVLILSVIGMLAFIFSSILVALKEYHHLKYFCSPFG